MDTQLPELFCVICGQPLVGEPDDQPDWPTGPMCGNCYQAREMDNDLWMIELNDDSTDHDADDDSSEDQ